MTFDQLFTDASSTVKEAFESVGDSTAANAASNLEFLLAAELAVARQPRRRDVRLAALASVWMSIGDLVETDAEARDALMQALRMAREAQRLAPQPRFVIHG